MYRNLHPNKEFLSMKEWISIKKKCKTRADWVAAIQDVQKKYLVSYTEREARDVEFDLREKPMKIYMKVIPNGAYLENYLVINITITRHPDIGRIAKNSVYYHK